MEGKFYRHKTPEHPHTNMAKAGLNMMTRTSAEDFAAVRIYMNAVDTGWINDENPLEVARYGGHPAHEWHACGGVLGTLTEGGHLGCDQSARAARDGREIADRSNFQTPIDEVDAAARVLDPVLVGIRDGMPMHGQFYKDYAPTEW
jgi:NAD(P)-dependent dehydrogenase (short-subunit alcohol dehydrogenase family)